MNPLYFHPEQLGSPEFIQEYGLKFAYQAGAMANAISSTNLVIALGKAGYLGSFGAGGLDFNQLEQAIKTIQAALPEGPYLFNLLHSPDPGVERKVVDLYLQYHITAIEASAFVNPTSNIIYYRAAGLIQAQNGQLQAQNRVIAKISRTEVAEKFIRPPEHKILNELVNQQRITEAQAELAAKLPIATDITVEADSGGHTDNQVLTCLFPTIKKLADEIQQQYNYSTKIRVGAAGGISTPEAAAAAFMMGADYVVTGSINQSAVEAGTSDYVKKLLSDVKLNDTAMCPSADMFEMGSKVQVLKRGTLYPFRAEKLYQLYRQYNSLDEIPQSDIKNLEETIFQKNLDTIWKETIAFFNARSPEQILKAEKNPKVKMALIFRWYLGQSSSWAIRDHAPYKKDYQVWCGPAMGAFNEYVKNTSLEKPENRSVTKIAEFIMQGAAALFQRKFQRKSEEPVKALSLGETKLGKLQLAQSIATFEKGKKRLPAGAHYNYKNILEDLVIPFKKGSGSRVWDMDDNEHLDLFCKFGALIVGHCNPSYDEALKKNIGKLTSVDNCGIEHQLCEKLSELIPCAEMVRFGLSGTESVQNAIRLARAYSGKKRFIR
ncbi:MAG: 2-nitropropane dioxygenase, partial [Gammaproteobacteria bacterium]|nr:2-nitropropane dioxygenase [Gammaproteobacteria bacterium]